MLKILYFVFALSLAGNSYPVEGPKAGDISKADPSIDGSQGNGSNDAKAPAAPQTPLTIPLAIEIKPTIGQQPAAPVETPDTEQAKQTLKAEQDTAKYTGLLFVIGLVTAVIFIVQLVFIYGQIKLSRKEYLASHPPDLIVRRVLLSVEKPGYIQYNIVNNGESDATITKGEVRARLDLITEEPRPYFPPYNDDGIIIDKLGGKKVRVGETLRLDELCPCLNESMKLIERGGTHEVMLIGWMTYENDGKTTGYTAFARLYRPGLGGFGLFDKIPFMPEHDEWEYRTQGNKRG